VVSRDRRRIRFGPRCECQLRAKDILAVGPVGSLDETAGRPCYVDTCDDRECAS
jgi:hypothetical protein